MPTYALCELLFTEFWAYRTRLDCESGATHNLNHAFKPIAEQALRSNQTIVPQRLYAALAQKEKGTKPFYSSRGREFKFQIHHQLRS
jgi:hypothetical protein